MATPPGDERRSQSPQSVTRVIRLLEALCASDAPMSLADLSRALSTPKLVDHIVSSHHAYLRSVLPFVRNLATKVARVHGKHNPKLRKLESLVVVLHDTLIPHLDQEEATVFPALLGAGRKDATAPLIRDMVDEHHEVGEQLAKLRELSDDFTYPEWACGSYRTMIAELAELQRDVHVHVHVENNVLAPRFA